MKIAPTPENENKRLKALLSCDILDTPVQSFFDRITVLAAEIFDVPICLVSLVDEKRQWFKSSYGLGIQESPRDISFCGHVVFSEETMVINNATKDERFADNPHVKGDFHLRFYAGAPIYSKEGYVLGTVCLIDRKPRRLKSKQVQILENLASQVSDLILLNKANDQLSNLLKQNRDIEKMSKAGGWSLDPKTGEVTWSVEVYNIYKIPVGTPTNKFDAISFYVESDRERISKCVEECIQLYKPFDEEFEFVDSEGTHKWVRSQGEPILGEGGKLTRIAGAFQDITKLKRREVALQRLTSDLRESNNRLGLALDTLNMGVWDMSLRDEFLIWDRRMFQIFGEKPTNTMSGNLIWQRALHPDDVESFHRDFQRCLQSEQKEFRRAFRIIRTDGETRHVQMVANVIREENKKAIRVVGVNWDFTEEFLKDEELKKQRKMTQHNAKLAAIGELAAGVAHEINNPLTIINGFINLLGKNLENDSWEKPRMLEVVKKIDISSERIAKIVKGLKNFSRVDKEIVSRFDLVEAIDETIQMLTGIYHKEGVEIGFEFDRSQSVVIEGSRGKIQQVLINLLSNAKDATDHQKDRNVQVSLVEAHGLIQLKVHDNGPGIPCELRERVFEPFFTTKDVDKGTGIGLSLVHSIVAEHKGEIRIEEGSEAGATFTVELPREKKVA